jgi:hypothetical protein
VRSRAWTKPKVNLHRANDSPSPDKSQIGVDIDDVESPCKRRKGLKRYIQEENKALNIKVIGVDELRGTEVAYSLYGELGVYYLNTRRVSPPKETSNDKSCFPTLTSPNPLKRYYESMRQPRAHRCSSRIQSFDPFPASIRAISPSPPKAAAQPSDVLGRGHKRSKSVRFDSAGST